MWPSVRVTTTGRAVSSSSSAPVGSSGRSQRDSSNPSRWTTGISPVDSPADQGEELLLRPGLPDVVVRQRAPGRGEVDVTVDEPGDDGRAGKLDRELGFRRVTGTHALHVPVIDEDPLPHRRMGERHDAGGAIQGPHGAAMIEESRSPSMTARASSRSARNLRLSRMKRRAPSRRLPVVERHQRVSHVAALDPRRRHRRPIGDIGVRVFRIGAVQVRERGVGEDRRGIRADGEAAHAMAAEPPEEGDRVRGLGPQERDDRFRRDRAVAIANVGDGEGGASRRPADRPAECPPPRDASGRPGRRAAIRRLVVST